VFGASVRCSPAPAHALTSVTDLRTALSFMAVALLSSRSPARVNTDTNSCPRWGEGEGGWLAGSMQSRAICPPPPPPLICESRIGAHLLRQPHAPHLAEVHRHGGHEGGARGGAQGRPLKHGCSTCPLTVGALVVLQCSHGRLGTLTCCCLAPAPLGTFVTGHSRQHAALQGRLRLLRHLHRRAEQEGERLVRVSQASGGESSVTGIGKGGTARQGGSHYCQYVRHGSRHQVHGARLVGGCQDGPVPAGGGLRGRWWSCRVTRARHKRAVSPRQRAARWMGRAIHSTVGGDPVRPQPCRSRT